MLGFYKSENEKLDHMTYQKRIAEEFLETYWMDHIVSTQQKTVRCKIFHKAVSICNRVKVALHIQLFAVYHTPASTRYINYFFNIFLFFIIDTISIPTINDINNKRYK